MKKIIEFIKKPLGIICLLLIASAVTILLSGIGQPASMTASASFPTLFMIFLIIALPIYRKFVLKKKAKFFIGLLFQFLALVLVGIISTIFSGFVTLNVYTASLFICSLLYMVVWDNFIDWLKKYSSTHKFMKIFQFPLTVLIILLIVAYLLPLILSDTFGTISDFVLFNIVLIGLALAVAIMRKQQGKQMKLLQGAGSNILVYLLIKIINAIFPFNSETKVLFIFIASAGWVHYNFEFLIKAFKLMKNARPNLDTGISPAPTPLPVGTAKKTKKSTEKEITTLNAWIIIGKQLMLGIIKKINVFFQNAEGFVKENKKIFNLKIVYIVAALVILLVILRVCFQLFFVRIIDFTPKGMVGNKTAISVTFSEPVDLKTDINAVDCFKIEPELKGEYRQQDERTIVFTPNESLKPSTRYKVSFNNKNIRNEKKQIQWFGNTEFNTSLFAVSNMNMFYSYDLIRNVEKQAVGEVNFNYPVDKDELKKNLKVFEGNKELQIEIENSNILNRYYLKTGVVTKGNEEKTIRFEISDKLNCISGTLPLSNKYVKEMVLPAKLKLAVKEITTWHQAGDTYISVEFNMPVSSDQINGKIKITPEIPYKVETEYCYALLKANFLPNKNYTVEVMPGIISKFGDILEKDNTQKTDVMIKDLPPKIEFASKGNIMPLGGEMNLELKTINIDKIKIDVNKVFKNQIPEFFNNSYRTSRAIVFSSEYMVTGGQINEEVTSYINLRKLHELPYKGLFEISVYDQNYRTSSSTWVLCTDLGIMAKESGDNLIVRVHSVSTLEPVADVKIKLYSYSDQIMQEVYTGDDGAVVINNWRDKYVQGLNTNFILNAAYIIAEKGEDYSILHFNNRRINQENFQIAGEQNGIRNLKVMLTTERGVYRPGETVYFTAIARNYELNTPNKTRLKLIINTPTREPFFNNEKITDKDGMLSFNVNIPKQALTGEYEALIYEGNVELCRTSFKVEEFIPDKIKTEIKTAKDEFYFDDKIEFSVIAKQLFGAPASGMKVSSVVKFLERDFFSKKYPDYSFKDTTRSYEPDSEDLGDDKLDGYGEKKYVLEIPVLKPQSCIKAQIYSEVYDSSNRPVSAIKYADVYCYPYYLGLKIGKKQFYQTKQDVHVSYVCVDAKDNPQKTKNINLVLKRKAWYSIFREVGWTSGRYSSESYEEVLKQESVDIDGTGEFSFVPDIPGEYTVYMGTESGSSVTQTITVLGPGYETTQIESPERLQIESDKKIYSGSDTASFTFACPFDGKLFVSLEREKVFETKIIDVTNRLAVVSFDMKNEFVPNVYVVGMLIRKPSENLKTMPMVSFGILPVMLDKKPNTISMDLKCPDKANASEGIDVSLHIDGNSSNGGVVLSAVNEGILQITNYITPDPLEYFFKKKMLSTGTYSIFEMVLPEIRALKEAIGGGENMSMARRHLNPVEAVKPKSLALYSGILNPDELGNIKYHFDTVGFNGEIRVMVLAASGNKFGSKQKSVTVFDPIVLIPSFPRVVGPEDSFRVPVKIYNKTGNDGKFNVKIAFKGPVKLNGPVEKDVSLKNESEDQVYYNFSSTSNAGVASFTISAAGNGVSVFMTENLSVRPVTHLETVRRSGELNAGQSVSIEVPKEYIDYGKVARYTASSYPLVKYLSALDYLISYPHGCAEQITSKMFPMIYMKELGYATGMFGDKANVIDEYIKDGIKNLESFQLNDGSFVFWPGENQGNEWLSNYVSHFLLEAQREGYPVSAEVINKLTARIERISARPEQGRLDRSNFQEFPNLNVYVLYLKALISNPDKEAMSYLKTKKLETLSELDRCLLSLCYSEIGDKKTALEVLKADWKSLFIKREQDNEFNSPVRNTAAYLMALSAADPANPKIDNIINYLGNQLKDGSFGTTQENSWALLSLSSAIKWTKRDTSIELNVDGITKQFEGEIPAGTIAEKDAKKISLKNISGSKIYYDLLSEGTPLKKRNMSVSKGISITKEYFDDKGKKLNLKSVVQGQQVIVTIKVNPSSEVKNLVIVDLIPGGMEIDNTRLKSRGELGFTPECNLNVSYQDIRDDRMIIVSDSINGEASYSYSLRAINSGTFVIPNAYTEAMYDPEIRAEAYEKENIVVVDSN